MKKRKPVNLAASVRQRLLNRAREKGEDFNLILTRYGLERLLYRLALSQYADRFILKGAMLFTVWANRVYRPTRDLDLLGYGDSSQQTLMKVFQDICLADVEPDGLVFDVSSVRLSEIRENQEYGGCRVQVIAYLARAQITLQIDIGFGDVIRPEAVQIEYPTLLDFAAPRIWAYPREAVVAEKLQAIVALGMANTRMKDFYDLWVIASQFSFDGLSLVGAIKATFAQRGTQIPSDVPIALSEAFAEDQDKARQWQAFLQRTGLGERGTDLSQVITELRVFLIPPILAALKGEALTQSWANGGPWS
jgi:predicted nucleotidyltransferase component of viral defense system